MLELPPFVEVAPALLLTADALDWVATGLPPEPNVPPPKAAEPPPWDAETIPPAATTTAELELSELQPVSESNSEKENANR